jgi:prepilin-type N-terminal cleavage/methylation domain-containing protein
MKKIKKNALKGFTLIELIVVVAVFGILMAATLTFVQPTSKVMKHASEYSGATNMVDNVRRIVEDNLRFANRMNVYAGPDVSAGEEAWRQSEVNVLRHKFYFDDANRVTYKQDKVYVLKIDNPEESEFAGFSAGSQKPGRVSIWEYDGGVLNTANSKEWAITQGVYDEYSFSLSYGITWTTTPKMIAGVQWNIIDSGTYTDFNGADKFVAPSNFQLILDIYKNAYDDRSNHSGSYKLANTSVSNVVALSFVNMVNGTTGTIKDEEIVLKTSDPLNPTTTENRVRYEYKGGTSSKDLYFIYTLPEIP